MFNRNFDKERQKRTLSATSLGGLFFWCLTSCQLAPIPVEQNLCGPLPLELAEFTEARDQSRSFRKRMNHFIETVRQDMKPEVPIHPELLKQVPQFRAEYFSLREPFFKQAFLHASKIVEKLDSRNQHALLFRTSQSLFAATELVKNFRVTGAMINLHPTFRTLWNESDLTHGIPRDSWTQSLENSQKAVFRDFFRAGLERLQIHQVRLENYWEGHDCQFLTLYPLGIEKGIQEVRENVEILEVDFVEMYSDEDERELIELVEESKKIREVWAQRAQEIYDAIEYERGLIRGEVRLEVYEIGGNYLRLRESLYYLAFKHLPKLTRPDIPYRPEDRLRGIGISLLAGLTLYGNAQALENQVLRVPEIRTLLNQGDPVLRIPEGFWDQVLGEFTRIKYRQLLEEGLWDFEELLNTQEESVIQKDRFLVYVQAELANNPMVVEIRGDTFFEQMARSLYFQSKGAFEFLKGIIKGVQYRSSQIFVNIMSMVELRNGKLYAETYWEEFVKDRLKPGDILLEKSPFRLTERLVPGYFAHVALYVGTPEDLRQLDLLSLPHVRAHLSELAEGKTIAEALRDGTQLSSLNKFLDVDDLVILRPKAHIIPAEDIRAAISQAFSHIGKKYDFNFDTNSWDAVTCSEMIFHSYMHVPWAYGKILNSYTIAPDDIAIFAGSDDQRPFSLITVIHDGQLVHDQLTDLHNEELYIRLLRGRYSYGFPENLIDRHPLESSF
jgi:hypothetical protein